MKIKKEMRLNYDERLIFQIKKENLNVMSCKVFENRIRLIINRKLKLIYKRKFETYPVYY